MEILQNNSGVKNTKNKTSQFDRLRNENQTKHDIDKGGLDKKNKKRKQLSKRGRKLSSEKNDELDIVDYGLEFDEPVDETFGNDN